MVTGLDWRAWPVLEELSALDWDGADEQLATRVARRYYELTGASIYLPYRSRCRATRHAGFVVGYVRCVRDAHPDHQGHVF
jgi:hypothetical protein